MKLPTLFAFRLVFGIAIHVNSRPHHRLVDVTSVVDTSRLSDVSVNLSCDLCKVIVGVIDDLISANKTEEEVVAIATEICIAFKIESERVCKAVTIEYKVNISLYFYFTSQ